MRGYQGLAKHVLSAALPLALAACDDEDGPSLEEGRTSISASVEGAMNHLQEDVADLKIHCYRKLFGECILSERDPQTNKPIIGPCPFVTEESVDLTYVNTIEGDAMLRTGIHEDVAEGDYLCSAGMPGYEDDPLINPESEAMFPPLSIGIPTSDTEDIFFSLSVKDGQENKMNLQFESDLGPESESENEGNEEADVDRSLLIS